MYLSEVVHVVTSEVLISLESLLLRYCEERLKINLYSIKHLYEYLFLARLMDEEACSEAEVVGVHTIQHLFGLLVLKGV